MVTFLVLLAASAAAAELPALPAMQPDAGAATCQLNIQGQFIERLQLQRKPESGVYDPRDSIVMNRPGAGRSLPAGTYRVARIDLEGGYVCPAPFIVREGVVDKGWFTLAPDKPHLLRLGAPLKPTVNAARQGRLFRFGYQLQDAEGRFYFRVKRDQPPRFTIYRDGRVVRSGRFEYG